MELRARVGSVDAETLRTFVVGDLVALSVFLILGELRHGYNPLEVPGRVALVALPFLAGWLVFGAFVGAYSAGVSDSPRALAATTLLGWFLGDLAAQGLRSTPVLPGGADPAFFAVAFLFGAVLLLLWRGARTLLPRIAG